MGRRSGMFQLSQNAVVLFDLGHDAFYFGGRLRDLRGPSGRGCRAARAHRR